MNAQKLDQPGLLDVSPVLETGSLAPLSTHWIPLHELLVHWTAIDTVLLPTPVDTLRPCATCTKRPITGVAPPSRWIPCCRQTWTRARQLSRIARTQQERLWALTEEVRAEVQAWRAQQGQQEQQEVSA